MTDVPLVLTHTEKGVATVTLNRPRSRNALSKALIDALTLALDQADADPEVRCVLLLAAGPDFAAGADVKEMASLDAVEVVSTDFAGCCTRLASVGKPVIAAVQGHAIGGGCELVEMCDIVVAGENAKFGHPEILLGTMPGAGGTQRLARLSGRHIAMDLLLSGRFLTAIEAKGVGLVSRVVPDEALSDEARGLAEHIARLSNPVARAIKASVNAASNAPLPEGLLLERKLFQLTFLLADRQEGMSAFIEKRPPKFRNG